jgi:uncharacterized peroxidase-related enzyme
VLVERFERDWRSAGLAEPTRAALAFAEKLTLRPKEISRKDLLELRSAGFSDAEIQDIVQIAAFFNYINRVADALGVPPEPEMSPWARRES